MQSTLIDNCALLDASAPSGVITGCHVAVEDGRIEYAGPADAHAQKAPAEHTIDAGGALVLPGLVNAHTHVPMTLLRSVANDVPLREWLNDRIWPLEARFDSDMIYWGTLLGITEMLSNGVTAFAEMYFFMDDIAKAVEKSGIRASLYRAVMGVEDDEGRIDDAEAVYKRWNGAANGRIQVGLGPHAEYTCSPKVLTQSLERAQKLGCGLHIHISETRPEHEACKETRGKTPARHFYDLGLLDVPCILAHGVMLEKEDMALIAEKGAVIAHCPGSNLILASGVAPVKEMLDAGVTVALGTDGAASNNRLDVWREMYLAAVLQKGRLHDAAALPAETALKMAAEAGAKALGLEGEAGALKPGARADVILVDTDKPHYWPDTDMRNHLVYSGSASDVILTMVDGEVLYNRGEYTVLDIGEIRYNIQSIARRLFV
jgi:5-methylthioadenosine/S-adenosylhomocysteine deaminase